MSGEGSLECTGEWGLLGPLVAQCGTRPGEIQCLWCWWANRSRIYVLVNLTWWN